MRRENARSTLEPAQRAWAERGLKGLIPFHGHPYLSYLMSALADGGIRDVCLVVGPGDDPIRLHYESMATMRLRIRFAVQIEPLGSAHALLAAESEAEGEPFLVLNSDNVYPASVIERVRTIAGSGLAGFRLDALVAGGIPAERVAGYALVEVDEHGFLEHIVEKPGAEAVRTVPGDALVSMTCWRFDASIFDACRSIAPSMRGELELPDAVSVALERGERFRVLPVPEPVLDLTSREDVPIMAERLRGVSVRL
jgi:dTDP-glucose pyrophosphorylase